MEMQSVDVVIDLAGSITRQFGLNLGRHIAPNLAERLGNRASRGAGFEVVLQHKSRVLFG